MMNKHRQERYPHLNLTWNLAQMDRIMDLAHRGVSADDIAFQMDATRAEIVALAQRNGFFVRRLRGAPQLPSVSIQRGE